MNPTMMLMMLRNPSMIKQMIISRAPTYMKETKAKNAKKAKSNNGNNGNGGQP